MTTVRLLVVTRVRQSSPETRCDARALSVPFDTARVLESHVLRPPDNVEYGFDPHDDSDYLIIHGNDVWGNGEVLRLRVEVPCVRK